MLISTVSNDHLAVSLFESAASLFALQVFENRHK
jgi:hypothetical protein